MNPLEVSQRFFDELASQWDNDHENPKLQRLYSIFAELIPKIDGPVLDVGCGTGIMIPVLRSQLTPGSKIVELDLSANMIRRSKEKHSHLMDVHFSIADAHYLPFHDETFRTVVCFAVLPHFHDPVMALAEIKRNLQPGGIIIILHLMGHSELNEMHRKAGRAVEGHALQSIDVVADQVKSLGFKLIKTIEQSDLYLILAKRRK